MGRVLMMMTTMIWGKQKQKYVLTQWICPRSGICFGLGDLPPDPPREGLLSSTRKKLTRSAFTKVWAA